MLNERSYTQKLQELLTLMGLMNEIQSTHNVDQGREKRVVTGGIVKGSFRSPDPVPCLCRGVGFMAVQLVKSYLYICVRLVFYTTLILGINSFLKDKTSIKRPWNPLIYTSFCFLPANHLHVLMAPPTHILCCLQNSFIYQSHTAKCLLYPGDRMSASGFTALSRPGPGPCVVLRG